jgi:hypothetical protein
MEYSQIRSLNEQQFNAEMSRRTTVRFNTADANEVSRIEKFLDLRPSVLTSQQLRIEDMDCSCGKKLTFFDFIFTAVCDYGHSKSFVAHTLLGSKFIINQPRQVRCSSCLTLSPNAQNYQCFGYGCCPVPPPPPPVIPPPP